MELYLISYEKFFDGETELVSQLLENHKFTFHLRKPGASFEEYKNYLSEIPENLHGQIMLHGAYDLIHEFDVKGLHFSTKNRHLKSSFDGRLCSTSSHSLQEAEELDKEYNYQFLSPVFPSISKPGYKGELDLAEVQNYLQRQRPGKIVALGGVTEKHLEKLNRMGFDGVALLGRIWGNNPSTDKNIVNRFNLLFESKGVWRI